MSKITNLMSKPITWGAVIITYLITIVLYAIVMGWMFRKPIAEKVKNLKSKRNG
jgi:hypothetical protein